MSTVIEATITIPSRLHGDRQWRRVGTRPYTNWKGEIVALATWQSNCVICNEPFAMTIPAR